MKMYTRADDLSSICLDPDAENKRKTFLSDSLMRLSQLDALERAASASPSFLAVCLLYFVSSVSSLLILLRMQFMGSALANRYTIVFPVLSLLCGCAAANAVSFWMARTHVHTTAARAATGAMLMTSLGCASVFFIVQSNPSNRHDACIVSIVCGLTAVFCFLTPCMSRRRWLHFA